ncbi:MAG: 50S ribosomal protein L17 [Candidatus Omnitrophica bacterium]|nr:50S ribosomal protein L17 [Candidatus Omnitrophota bacterium]
MRHGKIRGRLSRNLSSRKALLRSLVIALFTYQRIKTTLAKAKEARKLAEELITLARNDNLAARRQAFDTLRDKKIIRLLFTDISPRFNGRPGGYTRIMRLGTRSGDGAEMAILELVEQRVKESQAPKKESKKAAVEKQVEVKEAKKEPAKLESEKAPEIKKPEVEKKHEAEKRLEEKKPEPEKKPESEKKTKLPEEKPKKGKGFVTGLRDFFKKK